MNTPLLDRIAARRSEREASNRVTPRLPERPAPTRKPAWLERLQAKDMSSYDH